MRAIVLICLYVLCSINTILTRNAEQKWYKSQHNKSYYIDERYQYNWHEAFLKCSLMKMSLLTLETFEEYEDLVEILKENNFAFKGPHLWIGATGAKKQFAWIANSQPVFTIKWLDLHNPDNWNNEENCLHFWENTTEINDRKCDYKYGFICEENPHFNNDKANYNNIQLTIINGGK